MILILELLINRLIDKYIEMNNEQVVLQTKYVDKK